MKDWKRQLKIAIPVLILEWLLFLIDLYIFNKFSILLLTLAVGWTIWSIILIPRVRKQLRYEKKLKLLVPLRLRLLIEEEIVDEAILNMINIYVIERYLRKKKLNNIQNKD